MYDLLHSVLCGIPRPGIIIIVHSLRLPSSDRNEWPGSGAVTHAMTSIMLLLDGILMLLVDRSPDALVVY